MIDSAFLPSLKLTMHAIIFLPCLLLKDTKMLTKLPVQQEHVQRVFCYTEFERFATWSGRRHIHRFRLWCRSYKLERKAAAILDNLLRSGLSRVQPPTCLIGLRSSEQATSGH